MLKYQMLGNAMVPRDKVALRARFNGLDQGKGGYGTIEP